MTSGAEATDSSPRPGLQRAERKAIEGQVYFLHESLSNAFVRISVEKRKAEFSGLGAEIRQLRCQPNADDLRVTAAVMAHRPGLCILKATNVMAW